MEGRCEDESTKGQRVSQYIQSLLVVGYHITTKWVPCISHHKREREVVCLAHTKSAWSMFAMNCRERLQWSRLVTNEEAGPRRLAPPEPDFSERMWATFW